MADLYACICLDLIRPAWPGPERSHEIRRSISTLSHILPSLPPSTHPRHTHTAAMFFSVYETMKSAMEPVAADSGYAPLVHMAAASMGETVRY